MKIFHLQFSKGLADSVSGKEPPLMQEMQERQVPSLGQEDALEWGAATTWMLAWRILCTKEPGRPWSLGWPRVRCDESDTSNL